MNDFDALRNALRALPDTNDLTTTFNDHSCEQLRKTIVAQEEGNVGRGDLAGLVRHVLRRGALVKDRDFMLSVPSLPSWPNAELWKESNVQIIGSDQKSFRLRATEPWGAEWLPGSKEFFPFECTYKEEDRRKGWPSSPHLPLDTALQFGLALDPERFKGYQGPGQRLAVRSSFFLKPGGTLVVNLPTGTGKSLVAWAPSLLSKPNELTVMITPTIALAIDQERQLRELYPCVPGGLPEEMAWHGGLSEDVKKLIRRRLQSNKQRILITSPESFVGGLSRDLYRAAESGLLRYFVVDEAHLVAQWGNDFRPEFQYMSGMRRELIKRCPPSKAFRTLLLSATLTQESFDVLESLFSDGDFDSVNAVALRPEPEYWQSNSVSSAERKQKIRELIRVVPRPFLLYVTTQSDANDWYEEVRGMGILRSGCVHGGTSNEHRERAIDQWRSGAIDCVVATSAFGLGMDKSDVRAVIHACIPESIDRFYQEVGRAGRDGRASVSMLLPCEEADRDTAKTISTDRIISLDKGRDRWGDLISTGEYAVSTGIWRINLKNRPSHIQQDSDANVAWNLRTLVLLNRAGVIRFESQEPPTVEKKEEESDQEFDLRRQEIMDEYYTTAYVRVLNDGHRDEKVWETVVQAERDRMYAASNDAYKRIEQLLEGKTEIGQLLKATYTVATQNGGPVPQHSCSGCSVCRSRGVETSQRFAHPEPDLVTCIQHGGVEKLQQLFRVQSEVVFVRVNEHQSERETMRLCMNMVKKLAARGIDEFAIPDEWKSKSAWKRVHEASPRGFVIASPLGEYDHRKNDLRVPRATFLFNNQSPLVSREIINMDRPFHVIVVPENAREAGTERPFFTAVNNYIHDHDLIRRLGQ
jgi:ATP-dependent DNA helicase RecQ